MVKMYTALMFQHIFKHNDHTKLVKQVHNSARTCVFYNLIFDCIYSFHHPRNLPKFEKHRFFMRIVCFFLFATKQKQTNGTNQINLHKRTKCREKILSLFHFHFLSSPFRSFVSFLQYSSLALCKTRKKSNSTYLM